MLSARLLWVRRTLLVGLMLLGADAFGQGVYLSPLRFDLNGQTRITVETAKSLKGGGAARQSIEQRHSFDLSGLSSGFIWKRWFSSLSLGVRSSFDYLIADQRISGGTGRSGRTKTDQWHADNQFNVRLALLPGSRMPGELGFQLQQGLSSDGGVGNRRYRINLGQRFSPLSRRSLKLGGRYEWERTDAERVSTRQSFGLDVDDSFGAHRVGGQFEWRQDNGGDDGNQSYSLSGNHDYNSAARGLSFSSFASRIETSTSAGTSAVIDQFSNTIRWLPSLYRGRLDYNGSSRLVRSLTEFEAETSELLQLVHDSRLGYRMTPDLSLSGSAGLTYIDTDGGRLFTTENAALNYSAPERRWGRWEHRWDADAALSLAQASGGNSEALSAGVSQRFGLDFPRAEVGRSGLDLSQGVSSELFDGRFDPVYSVSHGVGYYRISRGDGSDSSWQLSGSDAREIDGGAVESQLLRSDYRHNTFALRGGALRSSVDLELSRQLDDEQAESVAVRVETELNYRTAGIFGIPRLSHSATGRLDLSKNIKVAEGDAVGSVLAWRLSNQLRWNWGLLSLSGLLEFTGSRDVADGRLRVEIQRQWRPLR